MAIVGLNTARRKVDRLIAQGDQLSLTFTIASGEAESAERVMQNEGEITKQFITELGRWTASTQRQLKAEASKFSKSIPSRIKMRIISNKFGEPTHISTTMSSTAYYLHYGAGRNYAGYKGSTWITKGVKRTTNPNSLGKAGTGKRTSSIRQFYSETIERNLNALADLVADYYGNQAVYFTLQSI